MFFMVKGAFQDRRSKIFNKLSFSAQHEIKRLEFADYKLKCRLIYFRRTLFPLGHSAYTKHHSVISFKLFQLYIAKIAYLLYNCSMFGTSVNSARCMITWNEPKGYNSTAKCNSKKSKIALSSFLKIVLSKGLLNKRERFFKGGLPVPFCGPNVNKR